MEAKKKSRKKIFAHVEFNIKLPVVYKEKKKWTVAYCPVLDLYSQGYTKQEAKKNIAEAISLFLLSCFERGTLDAVLKECGFVPEVKTDIHPEEKKQEMINVPLPFQVIKNRMNGCPA